MSRLTKSLLIWVGAVALVLVSAIGAIAAASRQSAPAVAVGLWPANGRVLANLADRATRVAPGQIGSPFERPLDPAAAQVARRAVALEPASSPALRVLGLERLQAGDRAGARRLMRLASATTKRDLLVNYWLIDDHARAGQVDRALAIYDQTLRTMEEGRGPTLTAMAAALSDPAVVEPFYRLLRARPPWSESFWHVTAQMPTALANAARLRVMLARDGIEVPREKDEMLLNALADRGLFAEGRAVYRAVAGAAARETALVRNGDFSRLPTFAPYDWRLTSTGAVGAVVNTGSGALEISGVDNARGEAARQLVELPPGRYSLEAELRSGSAVDGEPVVLELRCAEPRAASSTTGRIPLRTGRSAQLIDVGAGCRHYWLVVAVEVPEGSGGLDAAVDRIRLIRS